MKICHMIEETTKYSCRSCGSEAIIRNGHNKCGSPQYKCKACGACRVLTPKVKYTLEQKTTILRAYRERISLRGLQRVFGVAEYCAALAEGLGGEPTKFA